MDCKVKKNCESFSKVFYNVDLELSFWPTAKKDKKNKRWRTIYVSLGNQLINSNKEQKGSTTDESLVGSFQSFHPSGTTIAEKYVWEKTTVAYGPHARPSQIFPVPSMLQFTNEKPVFSVSDCLPWAVMHPVIGPFPVQTWFATELILQSCTSQDKYKNHNIF